MPPWSFLRLSSAGRKLFINFFSTFCLFPLQLHRRVVDSPTSFPDSARTSQSGMLPSVLRIAPRRHSPAVRLRPTLNLLTVQVGAPVLVLTHVRQFGS